MVAVSAASASADLDCRRWRGRCVERSTGALNRNPGASSYCRGQLGKRSGDPLGGRCIGGEFVVSAAKVLQHEGVTGDDHLRGPVGSVTRASAVFESAVIGPDRIVRVPLDVVPRRRDQFLQDGG
jgi:hypothetical protein